MIPVLILQFPDRPVALPESTGSGASGLRVVRKERLEQAVAVVKSGWFRVCVCAVGGEDAGLAEVGALRAAGPEVFLVAVAEEENRAGMERRALAAGADVVTGEEGLARCVGALVRWMEVSEERRTGAEGAEAGAVTGAGESLGEHELGVWREAMGLLQESEEGRFLDRFAEKLRERLGLHRLALFLGSGRDPARWVCRVAHGIEPGLRDCLDLSREHGLGKWISQTRRVLRSAEGSGGSLLEAEARRELRLIGGAAAVPVNDREGNVGVAVLGYPLAGLGHSEGVLRGVAFLLESLAETLRQRRKEAELRQREGLLARLLGASPNGFLVVGAEGGVELVSPAFARMLGWPAGGREGAREEDLPGEMREALARLAGMGGAEGAQGFEFRLAGKPAWRLRARRLEPGAGVASGARLVEAEDWSEREAERQRSVAASREALTQLIAERFAHEIRNSLVPLTTHLQLFDDRLGDAGFQQSLKEALQTETERIRRFTDQMLHLAPREGPGPRELELVELLRRTFARTPLAAGRPLPLHLPLDADEVWVEGEERGLAQAFLEVFLNALQATRGEETPVVEVRTDPAQRVARVRILDRGKGFEPGAAEQAFEPYFTTRNTGIGLGLTVARQVLQRMGGTITVVPPPPRYGAGVEITLPLCKIECELSQTSVNAGGPG